MNTLSGINSCSQLGSLHPLTSELIAQNKGLIEKALQQAGSFNGLGKLTKTEKPVLSMKEVIRGYNRGISRNEIVAWVFYKQSIGVPMTGWESYFLTKGDVNVRSVVATHDTIIKDNHFRDIREVKAGDLLGKYIKTHHYGNSLDYYIVRNNEGLFFVPAASCKLTKTAITYDQKAIDKLVMSGALYYLDGELIPYPIYVYGNIYSSIKKLEADKETILSKYGKEVFEKHEKALNERKPEMLTVTNADPNERPQISALSKFAVDVSLFSIKTVRDEYMTIDKQDEFKKVNGQVKNMTRREKIELNFDGEEKYILQDVFIKWLYSLNADLDFDKSDAINIANYYLRGKILKDDDLSKEEKAEIKANARIEGEKLFGRFLHEVLTHEDQQKLDYKWNYIYNAQADIAFERVPVGFTMSRYFKSGVLQLTPIQREGVAFMEMMGSGINAFDVGVGKTMTAIIAVANNLANGKCKRPLIVVPKPTYKKWVNEIIGYTDKKTKTFVPGVLSETGITVNDWGNLGTSSVGINVKKLNLKKAVPEKSITIVTHEGLTKIGYSEKAMQEIFDSLVNILTQNKYEKSDRDKEKELQKLREMMGVGLKDTIADIDTLGFDYVVIDEAHNFKNVFPGVESEEDQNGKKRKLYNISGSVSSKAQKAFLLLNYIQRKFGRNTMLLTATPFSNSPIEIYSMLSLVAYESLKKSGIENIRTFFDLFVLPTVEWTANYKEEIVEKEVIKTFRNRLLLQKLIYNHIHYKTGEEAGVKRPCKVNLPLMYDFAGKGQRLSPEKQVLTYIKMTPLQRELQNSIVALAKNATRGRLNSADMFRALNYSLDNALSPYLRSKEQPEDYKEFVDGSPKIKYAMECIKSVKAWHEKRGESVSGQVIYLNRGKLFFPYIKEYLQEELGFKTGIKYGHGKIDEVEIITSQITDARKENVKEAFLDGVCKIIIGTATIREGIDLQKKGTVIYNMYPDWNPTDIHQLEGRIWRQGNEFGFIRVVMPLVQDSMDVFVFQKLEEKTSRINDIWYRADRGNVLDLESLDPQEIKLALITDVSRLVHMFFDQEKEELQREFRRTNNQLNLIEEVKYDIKNYKNRRKDMIEIINRKYNHLISHICFDENYLKKDTPDRKADYKEHKRIYTNAKSLKEEIEKLRESGFADDKDILSIMRRMDRHTNDLNLMMWGESWKINSFKEYVAKVRKTERTVLTPRRYTIDSDLDPLVDDLKKEKIVILRKAFSFSDKTHEQIKLAKKKTDEEVLRMGERATKLSYLGDEQKSERWEALLKEIETKKSVLNVEGRTPEQRAEEFAKLNYLLSFSSDEMSSDSCAIPDKSAASKKRKPKSKSNPDRERLLRLAEAEAEAIMIMLELESLNN